MNTSKSDARVAEYRARAEAANAAAAASTLDRSRAQHQAAANAWLQLAEAEERKIAQQEAPPGMLRTPTPV